MQPNDLDEGDECFVPDHPVPGLVGKRWLREPIGVNRSIRDNQAEIAGAGQAPLIAQLGLGREGHGIF